MATKSGKATKPKKPPRKRAQKKRDLKTISALYLRGFSQPEIAKELKLSQSTISRDISDLIAGWQKEMVYNINEAKARELAKLDELELVYWGAWRRSLEDAVVKTVGVNTQGFVNTTRTEGQAGDPRFLDGVHKCIQKRCEILGVDAPKEVSGTINLVRRKIGVDMDKL